MPIHPAQLAARELARIDVEVVGSLEQAHPLVVAPEHVGRRRHQLDVLRSSDSASSAATKPSYASSHARAA